MIKINVLWDLILVMLILQDVVSQDQHTLIKTTDTLYVVQSIPRDKEDVYSKLISYVDKKKWVPIKVEFYNKDKRTNNQIGVKIKTLFNQKITKIDGMYVVQEAIMKNHSKGTFTVLTFF